MRYLSLDQQRQVFEMLQASPRWQECFWHLRLESLDRIELNGLLTLEALHELVTRLTEIAPHCRASPDVRVLDPFAD